MQQENSCLRCSQSLSQSPNMQLISYKSGYFLTQQECLQIICFYQLQMHSLFGQRLFLFKKSLHSTYTVFCVNLLGTGILLETHRALQLSFYLYLVVCSISLFQQS